MHSAMVTEKLNISLSKMQKEKLKKLCEYEHRKCSQQIVHMMDFYIKYRDKVNNSRK